MKISPLTLDNTDLTLKLTLNSPKSVDKYAEVERIYDSAITHVTRESHMELG